METTFNYFSVCIQTLDNVELNAYIIENGSRKRLETNLFLFKTEEEAREFGEKIKLGIGEMYSILKYEVDIDLDEEGKDLDLEEIHENTFQFINTIFESERNEGKDITGSVIVEWGWHQYVGYARDLFEIGIAGKYPFEKIKKEIDLITGNEESTYRKNYSILLTKEEFENSLDKRTEIEDAINSSYWKWNYFKHNPLSENIQNKIDTIV